MKINKYFELIEQKTSLAPIIVAVLSIISIGTSYVSKFFAWGQKGLFLYLQQNLHWLWLFALTLIVATLFIWTHRLYKQLVYGFSDQFKRDLSQNWNFKGPWRIAENGTLFVTGSDAGGITKTGAQWENYTFSFKARIMKDCLGVIVRAQDLSNYYMFQIRTDKIRPHRRVAIPDIEHKEGRTDEESR